MVHKLAKVYWDIIILAWRRKSIYVMVANDPILDLL
jgi:hypothetical protein